MNSICVGDSCVKSFDTVVRSADGERVALEVTAFYPSLGGSRLILDQSFEMVRSSRF